eukprot:Sdes_comp9734_c0_seq1m1243
MSLNSINAKELREQTMISQFCNVTGCGFAEAQSFLEKAKWQYEAAISEFYGFFNDPKTSLHCNCTSKIICSNCATSRLCVVGRVPNTPSNTPVTPPAFPVCYKNFGQLNISHN